MDVGLPRGYPIESPVLAPEPAITSLTLAIVTLAMTACTPEADDTAKSADTGRDTDSDTGTDTGSDTGTDTTANVVSGPLAFDVAGAKVANYNGGLAAFLADTAIECDGIAAFFENPGAGTLGEEQLLILFVRTASDCEDPFSDCAEGSFQGESVSGYYIGVSESGEQAAWQSDTGTISVMSASSSGVTGSFDLLGQMAPGGGTSDTPVTGSFSAAACALP